MVECGCGSSMTMTTQFTSKQDLTRRNWRSENMSHKAESLDGFTSEDVDLAWRAEIARRVGEVESGKESGISSQEAFAEARKSLAN